jgi:broad specificity phosphatase PhoE
MTMPITLTLVRHGESESNVAKRHFDKHKKSIKGEKALMSVHTSERRLTPRGVDQAQAAGVCLRRWFDEENIKIRRTRVYVSPYVRASETAGHLGLDNKWRMDNRLVERNWGDLDQMTHEERMHKYREEFDLRKEFAFFWRAGNGETLQDVFGRLRDFTNTLHRECSKKHVIVVTHGETMWAFRTLLEYWLPQDLREAMISRNKQTQIVNGRIVQYTRIDEKGKPQKRIVRMRMTHPTHPEDPKKNLPWQPVGRHEYSNADLLEYAEVHPRFLAA